jgi:phytanoyl-CoA hydroxylase
MITAEQRERYETDGYLVVQQLFTPAEVDFYRTHFMELHADVRFFGDEASPNSSDPLKRYPRMIHMHRQDETSLRWMLDPRLKHCLVGLLDREPYAVQTMFYFKPAGARGQALHQDQYYLRVQPGTCMAAWMAIDDCDEENGCLQVVPGSHRWPLLCTVPADTAQSFTDVTVPLPAGTAVQPVVMQAGDVLFFNGQLVHGSLPNTSAERFRRSLIGHYIEGAAEKVGQWYHPALHMDGRPLDMGVSPGGIRCGTWAEHDGSHQLELSGFEVVDPATHD